MYQTSNSARKIKDSKDTIDISHYLNILKRRKLLIIGISIISIVLGLMYINKATPVYQATTKIQADPTQPNATSQDNYILNSMIFLFYETQYEIIQSRNVAETVVDKLGLVQRYKDEQNDLDTEAEKFSFTVYIKNLIDILSKQEDNKNTQDTLTDQKLRTILAQSIQSALTVEGGTQSQIINISYTNENPVLAAEVVNSISESYIQFGLEARLSQIKDTAQWLGEQLEDLRAALQLSEDKLNDYRLNQNLMDTEQQERLASVQLQTLNAELVKAQTQVSEAEDLFSQILQVENSGGDYRSISPILRSDTIRDLVRDESNLIRRVKELSDRYGDRHPKMIAARSDLESSQQTIEREAAKIVENVKKEYRSALTQEKNVQRLIAKTREELQAYQSKSFELTRLEREVENNRRIYENFLARAMEADVSGDYDASSIRIIDKATIPEIPVKPKPIIILLFAVTFGLGAGVFLALLIEFSGKVLRTPDQMEEEISHPSLGVTPLIAKNAKTGTPEMQYINDKRSTFAESINSIRTSILFSNVENPPKTILITSSNGSEGKTTLAINLAVSLSQMGKTLLLELDLRKPAIERDLQLRTDKGLEDVLNGVETDNVYKTVAGIDNLKILPCGKVPKNPTEIIASSRFKKLLHKLKDEFDYIVIDSPPTLPVTDSCMISKLSDIVIVAIRAEKTKVGSARETISRLEKVNAPIAGLVLTQASSKNMSYYGEHYYRDEYYGVDKS